MSVQSDKFLDIIAEIIRLYKRIDELEGINRQLKILSGRESTCKKYNCVDRIPEGKDD